MPLSGLEFTVAFFPSAVPKKTKMTKTKKLRQGAISCRRRNLFVHQDAVAQIQQVQLVWLQSSWLKCRRKVFHSSQFFSEYFENL